MQCTPMSHWYTMATYTKFKVGNVCLLTKIHKLVVTFRKSVL